MNSKHFFRLETRGSITSKCHYIFPLSNDKMVSPHKVQTKWQKKVIIPVSTFLVSHWRPTRTKQLANKISHLENKQRSLLWFLSHDGHLHSVIGEDDKKSRGNLLQAVSHLIEKKRIKQSQVYTFMKYHTPCLNMIDNLHANILKHNDQCNYFLPYLVQTPCTWKKWRLNINIAPFETFFFWGTRISSE
jgi:predicted XRE-type DNA-binding protein